MVTRRDILEFAAAASLGSVGISQVTRAQATRAMMGHIAPKLENIRVGIIGVGNRGYTAVQRLRYIPSITLTAVCDLREDRVARVTSELRERKYRAQVKGFHSSPTAYRAMNDLDLDVIYIATPWDCHVAMAIDAMQKGKHALVEVPICTTIEEGLALIANSERHQRHCMMLENVCYGRTEMALRKMIQSGLLGTIVHAEGSYIHYLTDQLFEDTDKVPFRWRLQQSEKRNGNLYPTHGLGPVSQYLGITRQDEFEEIVSMSSLQAGLSEYALERYGRDSQEYRTTYVHGDMNTSLIRTRQGRTIMVQHDTTSPRPYSRHNVVTGTKGTFMGFPDRLYLHHVSKNEQFDPELTRRYLERYEHSAWQGRTEGPGHTDMDQVMDEAWAANMTQGRPMDISVYESVLWSIVAPLSERSIQLGHRAVKFPNI